MGWFDGFPFTSKEDRERKRNDFEKRVLPFGVEDQREKLAETLKALFPEFNPIDTMFAFYDAKDGYTLKETKEEGVEAALKRLRRQKWVDGRVEKIMLRFVELESGITSLDVYPTAEQVLEGLSGK